MAALTLRLVEPDGITPLQVDLTVTIGTTDGAALDQTTHQVLGGPHVIEAGTETVELPDLTASGIVPAGPVYWIAASWMSDLEERTWFWDGHQDAYLDELTTIPGELLPAPIVFEDYADLASRVSTLEQSGPGGGGTPGFQTHIDAPAPHPAYDDIQSLVLILENGLI
jgi:hypothetical protein